MKRKVYISFLGSTNYRQCIYKSESTGFISSEVTFVQEAILENLCKSWQESDVAYILLTSGDSGSRKKNWEDDGHLDWETKQPKKSTGLKNRIKNLKPPFKVYDINIPLGDTQSELWDIFDTIYTLLEEEDEVYFDVTHGFRYLPMLVLVLLNYARFLKNIAIKEISYGNYEGRDTLSNVAELMNLNGFVNLQDWTIAAGDFINNGNVTGLVNLTREEIKPVLQATAGKDQTASCLRSIVRDLELVSDNFNYIRGKKVNSSERIESLQENFNSLPDDSSGPLKPLFNKVKESISQFNPKEDILNCFKNALWCYRYGMIQSAYTALLETVISYVAEVKGMDKYSVSDRNFISSLLNVIEKKIPESLWMGDLGERKALARELMKDNMIIAVSKPYAGITSIRNDLNHYGYVLGDSSKEKVLKRFKTFFNTVSDVLKLGFYVD